MPEIKEQIQQEKVAAAQWYAEHKSELPAVGLRGMGTDKYTEYLRRAYSKLKHSGGGKLQRAKFEDHDSPEGVLSNLIDDCGSLVEHDRKDRITEQAEHDLSQREDASEPLYVSTENGYRKAGVIERLVRDHGEALACYFRHCIDREKCRDIKITVYGPSGVRKLSPAIVKKWALAVEKWVLALQMPLEEKARFLAELRQAVETERKEIAWRGSPEPESADRWAQLFAAVEPRKLWWECRRPQTPEQPLPPAWFEWVLCLADKKSQRWVLEAGPILSGNMLAENPLPLGQIKNLSGGGTWRNVPTTQNSFYLGSFGLLRPEDAGVVREFVLSRPKPSPVAEFKPLPPFAEKPAGKLEIKPEAISVRKSQESAATERKAEKRRQVENGLVRILDSDLSASEKREFVRIADLFKDGNTTKEIARRAKLSERTITGRLKQLRNAV
jgi:DNA-binding CsgD family transcriptional regulator